MKLRRVIVAAAAAVAFVGAALLLVPPGAGNGQMEGQVMSKTHEIGIVTKDGFVPLATLSFDDANTGTLVLIASHPRSPDLVRAWTDLSKLDVVSVKKTVRLDEGTDDEAIGIVDDDVAKGDPAYPAAVLRVLARNHGFDTRP